MKKNILYYLFSLSFLFVALIACSEDKNEDIEENPEDTEVVVPPIVDEDDDFETNSQVLTLSNPIVIVFNDEEAPSIANPYKEGGVTISTDGNHVTITSEGTSSELNYVLQGKTKNGSVKIYSDYKFILNLNGVSLINSSGPAINIQSSKKITVNAIDKTNNRLIDGENYVLHATEDMKAALFSEGQLIFDGNGSLSVLGKYKHAICSDDYIRIKNGNLLVQSNVSDGINANDYFQMDGGVIVVSSNNDGIDCGKGYIEINAGEITIVAKEGDGVKTSYKDTDESIVPNILINGGKLQVTVNGQAAKGIKSKKDITVKGGNITVRTTGNAYYDTSESDISSSACFKADGNMSVSGETTVIDAASTGSGGKGINVDGELVFDGGKVSVVTSGKQYVYDKNNDTAAKAIKSEGNLTVNGGSIYVKTSETEAEGLESKSTLTINGGELEVYAYDDGLNASNHIQINGGKTSVVSQTNDGIDSNGTLTVTGGTTVSVGSASPEEGFDCDQNTFKITGGIIVGYGGSTSVPTNSVSTQYAVAYGGGSYQLIHIEDASGNAILTFKSPLLLSKSTVLFSSPQMQGNTKYTIYTGGSVSGGTEFHGLYTDATYSKGVSASTFTTSSYVTTINVSSSPGGGGRP